MFEDESVRVWHTGDDVLIISFKTKMHVIGEGVINGLKLALAEAEKNFKGLVIWHADAAERRLPRPAPTCNRPCQRSCKAA